MGRDKAWLRLGATSLIERILGITTPLEAPRMIIADQVEAFAPLGLPVYPDLHPGTGPLGGLYTALVHSPLPSVLLLACDLPFLTSDFLHFLVQNLGTHQAVVPQTDKGLEPLCAVYTKSCKNAVEKALDRGDFRIVSFFPEVDVHFLLPSQWRRFDPHRTLFTNLNTPEDYRRARSQAQKPIL